MEGAGEESICTSIHICINNCVWKYVGVCEDTVLGEWLCSVLGKRLRFEVLVMVLEIKFIMGWR